MRPHGNRGLATQIHISVAVNPLHLQVEARKTAIPARPAAGRELLPEKRPPIRPKSPRRGPAFGISGSLGRLIRLRSRLLG